MRTHKDKRRGGFASRLAAWRSYRQFYRGHSRPLVMSLLVSMAQSLIVVPIALLIRRIFDSTLPAGQFSELVLAGGAIALLYTLHGAATLWTRYITLATTKTVIQNFLGELLKHCYTLSRAFYTKEDQGRLHTIMVQDTQRLDIMTNALFAQFAPAVFITAVVSAVLAYLNWVLFLVLVATFPLYVLLARTIGRTTKEKVHAFHRSFERFSQGMMFVLKYMDLTRSQAAEDVEMERQRAHLDDLRVTSGRMAWMRSAYISAQNVTIAVGAVLILMVGGRAVINGTMTLGELLSFYAIVAFLRSHLYTISTVIPQIIEGDESLATLHGLMSTHQPEPYSGSEQIELKGEIAFEAVSFGYGGEPILRELEVKLHPASTAAILGPNGSGKTTIANLILGFYCPEGGRLYADGRPYRELDLVHLRRQIGVVAQNAIIFSGSVWDNITYGSPEVSRQDVERASALANAQAFIEELPEGYDTQVGEGGVILSGGQRQQMAIARALLGRPRLLILDEPTNHLDSDAVAKLMQNFRSMKGSTTFLILTHDKEVLREADQVYRLHDGRIETAEGDTAPSPPLNFVPTRSLDE